MHTKGKHFRYNCFPCLATLFMHESSFLLLLGICQSLQFSAFPGSSTLSSTHTEMCIEPTKRQAFTNTPPLSHTTSCTWGLGNQPSLCISPPVPTSPDFSISLSPTQSGFQAISPGPLSSLTRKQMDSEKRNCAETKI